MRQTLPILFLFLGLAALLSGCEGDTLAQESKSTPHRLPVVRTTVEEVKAESVVREIGEAVAWEQVALTPEASGRVIETPYEPGDVIRAETPVVVRIDPTEYELGLKRSRARKRMAEASLALAKDEAERAEKLHASGNLPTKIRNLRRAEQEKAQAALEEAKAAVALAEKRLNDTILKGLPGYHLVQQNVEVEEFVAAGRPVCQLADLRRMRIRFHVSASTRTHLSRGDVIPFTVKAYPGRTFEGPIVRMVPQADPVVGRFPVELEYDNREGLLKDGMTTVASIRHRRSETRLRLPLTAVETTYQLAWCYVITSDDKAQKKRIRLLGEANDPSYVHVEGIDPGTAVVADISVGVTDGQPLSVLENRTTE